MNFFRIRKNELGKGFRISNNLLRDSLKVSSINVCISKRKNQFTRLKIAKMSNHISKNAIRSDIIGKPQKTIGTPLTNKTVKKPTISANVKLTSKMAGRKPFG